MGMILFLIICAVVWLAKMAFLGACADTLTSKDSGFVEKGIAASILKKNL